MSKEDRVNMEKEMGKVLIRLVIRVCSDFYLFVIIIIVIIIIIIIKRLLELLEL